MSHAASQTSVGYRWYRAPATIIARDAPAPRLRSPENRRFAHPQSRTPLALHSPGWRHTVSLGIAHELSPWIEHFARLPILRMKHQPYIRLSAFRLNRAPAGELTLNDERPRTVPVLFPEPFLGSDEPVALGGTEAAAS
jgi:hypothetical protein